MMLPWALAHQVPSTYFAEGSFFHLSKQGGLQPQLSIMQALFSFIVIGLECRVSALSHTNGGVSAVPRHSIPPAWQSQVRGQASSSPSLSALYGRVCGIWGFSPMPIPWDYVLPWEFVFTLKKKTMTVWYFYIATKAYKTLKISNKRNLIKSQFLLFIKLFLNEHFAF